MPSRNLLFLCKNGVTVEFAFDREKGVLSRIPLKFCEPDPGLESSSSDSSGSKYSNWREAEPPNIVGDPKLNGPSSVKSTKMSLSPFCTSFGLLLVGVVSSFILPSSSSSPSSSFSSSSSSSLSLVEVLWALFPFPVSSSSSK
eukprot:TRINITY_DN2864_c0_g1_i9.p2 TRINITY_DN2864_c0_g1~~TRINITY_DN2864_c0_g1_i9.p2  ORF type:complete len:143 (+),score=40.61 TRINITY_DN2864_c0_g1_i9:571-999(+)